MSDKKFCTLRAGLTGANNSWFQVGENVYVKFMPRGHGNRNHCILFKAPEDVKITKVKKEDAVKLGLERE